MGLLSSGGIPRPRAYHSDRRPGIVGQRHAPPRLPATLTPTVRAAALPATFTHTHPGFAAGPPRATYLSNPRRVRPCPTRASNPDQPTVAATDRAEPAAAQGYWP